MTNLVRGGHFLLPLSLRIIKIRTANAIINEIASYTDIGTTPLRGG